MGFVGSGVAETGGAARLPAVNLRKAHKEGVISSD